MQRSNKDIVLFSILACLWGVQAAVVLEQLLGLGRVPLLGRDVLLGELGSRMFPKWDLLIYLFFIVVTIIVGKVIFKYWHKPIHHWFLIIEVALTFLMISALFKILVCFNSPQLAQQSLTALIIITVLFKIFYPELEKLGKTMYQRLSTMSLSRYANAWWISMIVLMIYMPDVERVVAMIFMGDWLHHFDYLIMSVGWASLNGQMPYVDVASQYGVGLPIIFAKIIHVFGAFDYVAALSVMMWFVIIYFILTYLLVKYWLKSALIAGVAFLLIFRMQMFHYGVSPLIWSVPSASPLRFGLDVCWMMAILLHLRTCRSRWLIMAALYSGFAVYYMTSSGLCVMATFYAYLLALIVFPSLRRQLLSDPSKCGCYYLSWLLPIVSALIFFTATLKGHVLQKECWHNFLDYMEAFSLRGSLPMYESLKYRHFWAFIMSMVMPFTYMATLLYIGVGLYLDRIKKEWLFVALQAIYGLGNYQYYVVRSAITSYYVHVFSFVLIVCFWFMHGLEFLPLLWQKRLKAAAVILSFYALLTNQNYLAYPNLMNFSRNPMTDNLVIQRFPDRQGYFNNMSKNTKEEDKLPFNDLGTNQEEIRSEDDFKDDAALVNFYRTHFDFSQDAALIARLTEPTEPIALISSFETKILIQAGRKPLFYHFPLLTSRPMTFRTFPSDAADTPSYLGDTLGELEAHQPRYVFMEKVFLQDALPPSYQENNSRLLAMISYVRKYYQPWAQGEYLVAMKRKAGE